MINYNTVFIVDGPDCTGKTTLCNKLSEKYNIPYYHLTYYSDKKKHEQQFIDIFDKIKNNESFIVDRYIMSEIVYADVYRESKYFDTDLLINTLSNFIHNKNLIRIFTIPKDKEKFINFFEGKTEEREEMYFEGMDKVYDKYKEYLEQFDEIPVNYQIYDLFDEKLDEFVEKQ